MKDNVKSVLLMILVWVLAGLLAFTLAYFFVGAYTTPAYTAIISTAVSGHTELDDHLAILANFEPEFDDVTVVVTKPECKHDDLNIVYLEGVESPTPVEPVARVNLPIGYGVQDYVFELCEQYNLDPKIVFAIIQKESRCTLNAKGDNGRSLGLMQIQPRWHKERMNRLGCTDLMDPYQNVRVGIDILVELYGGGRSTEYVLMAYNGGPSYARKMAAAGEVSAYAKSVLKIARGLEVTYETQ